MRPTITPAVVFVALLLVLGSLVVGCAATADVQQRAGDKGQARAVKQGPEPEAAEVAAPVGKPCSDFYGPQEAFLYLDKHPEAAERLDPDDNGIPCDAPGQKFKDTPISLPTGETYEVSAYTVEKVRGVPGANVVVDTRDIGYLEFVHIGKDVVAEYGPDSKYGLRALTITFRNVKRSNEVDFGYYIADREALEAWKATYKQPFDMKPNVIGRYQQAGFFLLPDRTPQKEEYAVNEDSGACSGAGAQ
jgi:hypothetical protein